jgi:hypothetical protein
LPVAVADLVAASSGATASVSGGRSVSETSVSSMASSLSQSSIGTSMSSYATAASTAMYVFFSCEVLTALCDFKMFAITST